MIEGKKKEQKDFVKKIGLFEARVLIINPTLEEYKDVLGFDPKEDSKATEYLGESKDGNTYLRVAVWLKSVKTDELFSSPISFFLEDKERENKDGTKKQYINNIGQCTWADDQANLPEWFTTRQYREAFVGEEELYNFVRTWLGNLDYRSEETTLDVNANWKQFLKGNVKSLREQIDGEWCTNVVALATVVTKEKDGEIREYQNIFNKAFLPAYGLKHFRLVDYTSEDVLNKLAAKKPRDLKYHEKFVLDVTGEYGCRDAFLLKDLQDFNPNDFITSSDKVILPGDASY